MKGAAPKGTKGSLNNNHPFLERRSSRPTALRKGLHTTSMRPFAYLGFGFLRHSTSCIPCMDVGTGGIVSSYYRAIPRIK